MHNDVASSGPRDAGSGRGIGGGSHIMRTPVVTAILLAAATTVAATGDARYRLPIGDPARKDRDVPVVLDTMIDTATARTITPDDLAASLGATRLLLLGESH